MYNHDPKGTRYNSEEDTLSPQNVGGLHVRWSYPTVGPVSATPVVSVNVVYAGDLAGNFYAIEADDGELLWRRSGLTLVSPTALVMGKHILFGNYLGDFYALDRRTGETLWQTRPEPNPLAEIMGSPTKVGRYFALGITSQEENLSASPNYPCCSTRSSVVLMDPEDGHVVWQTYMITDDELAQGSSGAGVWSTPSYDAALGLIFVTTGNNYSPPGSSMSDSIVALDAATGAIVWVNQRHPDDIWNFTYPPSPDHPDFDFGDSPQVYTLPGGQKVVGAGQKSGFYHVLDAATGALVNMKQLMPGSSLGGLFSDSAFANGVAFTDGSDWDVGGAPAQGAVIAVTGDATRELWRFTLPNSAVYSGVAVANGVVYFSALNGNLYALKASTGAVLAALPIDASGSGPAVSDGRVFVGTGNPFVYFSTFSLPGHIVSLGL